MLLDSKVLVNCFPIVRGFEKKLKEKDMKRSLAIVAALAMVVSATVAQAADQAWFTLEGQGAGCAGLQVSQGPSQALTITNKPLTCTTLTIGYNFTSSAYEPNQLMAGFSLNLNGAAGTTASNAVPQNAAYNQPVGSLNSGGFLLNNLGWGASANNGPSGLVLKFDLNFTSKAPGDVRNITGDFGTSKQVYNSGYLWVGSVAGGPNSFGQNGYSNGDTDTVPGWGPQPVISISNIPVPEPTTLALLGFGAVALLRRKR